MIRLATAADIPALYDFYKELVADMRALGNEQWDDEYPAMMVQPNVEAGEVYVEAEDGVLRATVTLGTQPDPEFEHLPWIPADSLIYIERLAVGPRFQGQGLAKALMDFALAHAQKAGAEALRLYVSPENATAYHLYEQYGFSYVATIHFEFSGHPYHCMNRRV